MLLQPVLLVWTNQNLLSTGPTSPFSPAEASTLLDHTDGAVAVWVMQNDNDVRSAVVLDGPPADAVMDIAVETDAAFHMSRYTSGVWTDSGTQR